MSDVSQGFAKLGALSERSAPFSESEAIELVQTYFGIDGTVARFATEKDDTFRLTDHLGKRYTLKIANPAENPSEISFQIELLRHIAAVDPRLPVPKVFVDLNSRSQFSVLDRAGQNRQVHLLSYMEGVPLSDTSSSASERERVGEALGSLRLATSGFSHRSDSRAVAWDIKHLLGLVPLLEGIEDPIARRKLERGIGRFAGFSEQLARCRSQVLHNDFSKSNIVVDHARESFVTGIIDFGDAVRTAIAIDVSTALLNQLPSNSATDFFADGRDVLRGYMRVADLTDEELILIPHLVMGRVIARALLTTWRGKLFPENSKYILRNTDQGWFQLDWFLSKSVDEVSGSLLNQTASRALA